MITSVCAECQQVIGQKAGGEGISHGLCQRCARMATIEIGDEEIERKAIELFGVSDQGLSNPEEILYVLRDGTMLKSEDDPHYVVCGIDEVLEYAILDREDTLTLEQARETFKGMRNGDIADRLWSDAAIDICPEAFMHITGAARMGIETATKAYFHIVELPSVMQATVMEKLLRMGFRVDIEVGRPRMGPLLTVSIFKTLDPGLRARGIIRKIKEWVRVSKDHAKVNLEGFTTGEVPNLTSGKELEAKAVEEYGITENPLLAGFILRDGRFLDFSEGSGMRAQDHRNVGGLFSTEELKAVEGERTLMMWEFMARTGAIRIIPEGCGAEAPNTFPTRAQARSINDYALVCKGTIFLDIWKRGNPRAKNSGIFVAGSVDDLLRTARILEEHPDRFPERVRFLVGKTDWGLSGLHGLEDLADGEGDPILAEAILRLGLTNDLAEAIFILEDGRMLRGSPEAIRTRGFMMGHEAVCEGAAWRAWTDELLDQYFDLLEDGEIRSEEEDREQVLREIYRGDSEKERDDCIEFFMSRTGAVRHASFGSFTTATRLEVQSIGDPTDHQIRAMANGMVEHQSKWILVSLPEDHRFINFSKPPTTGQLRASIERAFEGREETLNVGVRAGLGEIHGAPHLEERCNCLDGWQDCCEKDLTDEEKLAVRAFGITQRHKEAGYVLRNGLMLDFSGRNELSQDTTFMKDVFEEDDYYRWDEKTRAYVPRNPVLSEDLETGADLEKDPQVLKRDGGHEQVCDDLALADQMLNDEIGMDLEEWVEETSHDVPSDTRGMGRLCERWFMNVTGAMRFHLDHKFVFAEVTKKITFEQAVQIVRAARDLPFDGEIFIDVFDEGWWGDEEGKEYAELSLTEGYPEPPVKTVILGVESAAAKSASAIVARVTERTKDPRIETTTGFARGLMILGRGGYGVFRGLPHASLGELPRVGRTFFKGYRKGDGRRITTGDSYWDSMFFVTATREGAEIYGPDIMTVVLKPDAKILVEGTKAFRSLSKGIPRGRNLLERSSLIVRRAEEAGYDAVYFERQTDLGTVIINMDSIESATASDGRPLRLFPGLAKVHKAASKLGELPRVGDGDSPDELAVKQVGLAGASKVRHRIPHLSGDLHPAAQELKDNWPSTYNIQEAALILRDGTRIAFGQNSSHEDILEDAVSKETLEEMKAKYPDWGLLYITYFLHETGAVRVVHGGSKIFFEATGEPSTAQMDVMLDAHAEGHTGRVFEIEFDRGAGDFVMYQEEFPTARGIRAFFQKRSGGHWTPHIFGGLDPLWQPETFNEIYEYLVEVAGDWTVTGQGPDGWDLWTMDVPLEDGRVVRVTGQYDGDLGTNTGEMVVEELELIKSGDDLGQLEFFQHPVVLPEKEEVKLKPPSEEELQEAREALEAARLMPDPEEEKSFELINVPEGEFDDPDTIEEEIDEIMQEIGEKVHAWLDYLGRYPGDLVMQKLEKGKIHGLTIKEAVENLAENVKTDINPETYDRWNWRAQRENFFFEMELAEPLGVYPGAKGELYWFQKFEGTVKDLNWIMDRFRRPEPDMGPESPWPKGMVVTFAGAWNAFTDIVTSVSRGKASARDQLKAFYDQFLVAGDAWKLAALYTPWGYFAAKEVNSETYELELKDYQVSKRVMKRELDLDAVYLEWGDMAPIVIAVDFWSDQENGGDPINMGEFFTLPEKYGVTIQAGHWPSGLVNKVRSCCVDELPLHLEALVCAIDNVFRPRIIAWRDPESKMEDLVSHLPDEPEETSMAAHLTEDQVLRQKFRKALEGFMVSDMCINNAHEKAKSNGWPSRLDEKYSNEEGFRAGGPWAPGKEDAIADLDEHWPAEEDDDDDLEGLGGSIEDELRRIGEYAATEVIVQDMGEGRVELQSKDRRYLYRGAERDIRKGLQKRITTPPPPASAWDEGMIRSFWFVLANRRFQLDDQGWFWGHLAPPEFFGATGRLGKKRRSGWVLADGEWGITSSTKDPEKPDMIFHTFTGLENQLSIPFAVLDRERDLTTEELRQVMRCVVLEVYRVVRQGIMQTGEAVRTIQLGLSRRFGMEPNTALAKLLDELVLSCRANRGVIEGSRRAVTFEGLHGAPVCVTCGKRA